MVSVNELFSEELDRLISVFTGDRKEFDIADLSVNEEAAVRKVFRSGIEKLRKVSPRLAADIEVQESLAIKVAKIFKGMVPGKKSYNFPAQSGGLGVAWLFPQAIVYASPPSASLPAYSSYTPNSWNISITAGTPSYILGGSGEAEYYKASPTVGSHSTILIFNNGVIEVGSTPKIQQFRIVAEGFTKYGPYTTTPLNEIPIEKDTCIYQYETPLGAMIITFDHGVKFSFMPDATGVSTIKLLGLVYYEFDFFRDLKTIAIW